MPPVPFMLIADDFAISDGVSDAILDLLEKKRLSGTGVMVNQAGWPRRAPDLAPYRGVRDLGLHLTLTLGAPLGVMPHVAPDGSLPSLRRLIGMAFARQMPRRELSDEIIRQIDAFTNAMGRRPDFIDGHQHVHVLPSIRDALFDAITRIDPQWKPWIRVPSDQLGSILARGVSIGKALFIALLSTGFARAAKGRGFPVNDSFSGVRAFDPDSDFADEFRRFLLVHGRRHLVMCHPGVSDNELAALDPVTTARDTEYEFLKSDRFLSLIADFDLVVERFQRS